MELADLSGWRKIPGSFHWKEKPITHLPDYYTRDYKGQNTLAAIHYQRCVHPDSSLCVTENLIFVLSLLIIRSLLPWCSFTQSLHMCYRHEEVLEWADLPDETGAAAFSAERSPVYSALLGELPSSLSVSEKESHHRHLRSSELFIFLCSCTFLGFILHFLCGSLHNSNHKPAFLTACSKPLICKTTELLNEGSKRTAFSPSFFLNRQNTKCNYI